MNSFAWLSARSVGEAAAAASMTLADAMVSGGSESHNGAIIKAGGIDVLDLLKEGLLTPATLVSLGGINGLGDIVEEPGAGIRIGALATLAKVTDHPLIRGRYAALAEAAASSESPQIRNVATLGGNLLQRPRCWYFRSLEYRCLRKGAITAMRSAATIDITRSSTTGRARSCTRRVHAKSFVPFLPFYFTTVWWDGVPYYYANDTYYLWSDDQRQYQVVAPPDGIESGGTPQAPASNQLFIYPKNGQSAEQQDKDKYECHRWAVSQSGFDPTVAGGVPSDAIPEKRNGYFRSQAACLEGRGYTVK
jgi:hypothetical protein